MARTPEYEVNGMRRDIDAMRILLKKSGWFDELGGWQRNVWNDEMALLELRPALQEKARRELAAEVMRAFGLTDSYPDTTAEVVEYPLVRGSDDKRESRKVTRVTFGADVFIDDVRTVAQSRDAAEASKRLGIKGGDSGE